VPFLNKERRAFAQNGFSFYRNRVLKVSTIAVYKPYYRFSVNNLPPKDARVSLRPPPPGLSAGSQPVPAFIIHHHFVFILTLQRPPL
jgi:hypothetical protein